MKSGSLVFLTAFVALAFSWTGFVLVPQLQLGRLEAAKTVPAGDAYPVARSGQARQGAEVYRSLGCVYCHSRQIGQQGTTVEVTLTSVGTNAANVLSAIQKAAPHLAATASLASVPQVLGQVADTALADDAVTAIAEAGGEATVAILPDGPDIRRRWGRRRSVAQDYLYDPVVQPGIRRFGPDLTDAGATRASAEWQLLHLYAPKTVVPDSTMPGYPFLFVERKIGKTPAPDALPLSGTFAPPDGHEVVPTEEAQALVAYLLSLRADAPLYESPVTPPPAPATNGVAVATK
ncbi:MAG TPA: cbb3-type cytochrome c oxidase subunit II [Verrucomicrobiota bacterium]|nr:cbb3-type cytochrome c oxidase subunit II [Verrucomicrobiota bacterium]HNT14920.1 cbb3-type cytochrome c oxidase subunit II [Verrucomicrobiota bacterium]